jgi:hypothetical protein
LFCIAVEDPIIKRERERERERVGIPLISLIPPHCYACPNLGPEFPLSYVVVLICSMV